MDEEFRHELTSLLNRHGAENGSNTPDFILAQYLTDCLRTFDAAIQRQAEWHGHIDEPGQSRTR